MPRTGCGLRTARGCVSVELDQYCCMHIFNSRDLCVIEDLPSLPGRRISVSTEARREGSRYVRDVTRAYWDALAQNLENGAEAIPLKESLARHSPAGFIKGHFCRLCYKGAGLSQGMFYCHPQNYMTKPALYIEISPVYTGQNAGVYRHSCCSGLRCGCFKGAGLRLAISCGEFRYHFSYCRHRHEPPPLKPPLPPKPPPPPNLHRQNHRCPEHLKQAENKPVKVALVYINKLISPMIIKTIAQAGKEDWMPVNPPAQPGK